MDILEIAQRLANVNVTRVLVRILKKPSIQKQITDLNTKVQLYGEGEDSTGTKLSQIGGGYAPMTISIKKRKGQPTNRVTLNDTGDFYKTFKVKVSGNADFTITSNSRKDGVDLHDRWGDNIEGLQDTNVLLVMEILEQEFYSEIFR